MSFQNLQNDVYWSGTEYLSVPGIAWLFTFNFVQQGYGDKEEINGYAWAVRDGDSAAVPEPGTMLLLSLGLMGVAGVRRKLRK